MLAREMFERLRQPQFAEPAELDAAPVEEQADEEKEAELSDAEFCRKMCADVEGVREGLVPSIAGAMRPVLKDQPWSPKRKRRNRYRKAFLRSPSSL